jgi:transposase-like protein
MTATLVIPAAAAAPAAAAPASDKPKNFPLRKRTGTAAFHLSTAAVGFGCEDLERMTEKEAVMWLADAQWGSTKEMPCVHCGTIDTHYWTPAEMRWKCKCCGKRFSVTSKTVFADHKLPIVKILKIAFAWVNGAAGVPALKLRRDWNVAYATVFTLAHKLREGIVRGFDNGPLAGIQEMDGMDINGRRYKEKRNKPQGGRSTGTPKIPVELLKPPEGTEFVGPPKPPKFGKTAQQPTDRRILLVMCQRGVSEGKGSSATRVAIALSESTKTVTAMAAQHASAESIIMSDEDPAYASFRELFAAHKTINHSVGYSDGKGTSNNQAESFNARMRRTAEGTYLAISNKYLKDYACETAWRSDTRKLSTGEKLKHVFRKALNVGLSQWWRGYTHGHHRESELLIEGAQPAPGRGRPKGWEPKPPK